MSGNFVRERQRIVYIYNIHVMEFPRRVDLPDGEM